MNIFVSSFDPEVAARWLDDFRVIKMTLESAQLLSTVYDGPYRPTHVNHPCTKWVRSDPANARWLLDHLKALSAEYTRRFDRVHKCATLIPHFSSLLGSINATPTSWVLCPPSILVLDPTPGYRALLAAKWYSSKRDPRWTNSDKPHWYLER